MKDLEIIKDGSLISVDNVYQLTKSFEDQVEKLKLEEKKISSDRKKLELYLENAKQFIKKYMVEQGLCELEGKTMIYKISNGNPKLLLKKPDLIPEEYWQTTTTTVRETKNEAIKDQLKMGDVIPGCELEETFTLKTVVKNGNG